MHDSQISSMSTLNESAIDIYYSDINADKQRLENPKGFFGKDLTLFNERYKMRQALHGILVGDVVYDSNSFKMRFSHHWGDSVQYSKAGSFYLCRNGSSQFSGSLYPGIDVNKIQPLPNMDYARGFWFFHNDFATAHNGVHFSMLVKHWQYDGIFETY